MTDAELIREWERKLKEEGLSMGAGERPWIQYSPDAESFPKKYSRDRKRIQPKTAKTCLRCGVKFFGRPNKKFHSETCRKRYFDYGPCKRLTRDGFVAVESEGKSDRAK